MKTVKNIKTTCFAGIILTFSASSALSQMVVTDPSNDAANGLALQRFAAQIDQGLTQIEMASEQIDKLTEQIQRLTSIKTSLEELYAEVKSVIDWPTDWLGAFDAELGQLINPTPPCELFPNLTLVATGTAGCGGEEETIAMTVESLTPDVGQEDLTEMVNNGQGSLRANALFVQRNLNIANASVESYERSTAYADRTQYLQSALANSTTLQDSTNINGMLLANLSMIMIENQKLLAISNVLNASSEALTTIDKITEASFMEFPIPDLD